MLLLLVGFCLFACAPDPEPPPPEDIPRPSARSPLPERPLELACQPVDQGGVFVPLLSETGCFDGLLPTDGLMPYTLRSPMWNDGALQERWIAVPSGSVIGYSADQPWSFPDGTVLVQALHRGFANPIETRLMARHGGTWKYATFRWEDGVAALLDNSLAETVTLEDGSVSEWFYPSPDGCRSCHAGGAIGPIAAQLATDYDYAGTIHSQIDEMARVGLFDVSQPAAPVALVSPADSGASDEERARGWLHGNCGHCHRDDGWVPPEMDMRLQSHLPLADMLICDVPVQFDTAPEAGTFRMSAGNSADSAIWNRVDAGWVTRMPPLGVSLTDPLAAELLPRWIDGRQDCEQEAL